MFNTLDRDSVRNSSNKMATLALLEMSLAAEFSKLCREVLALVSDCGGRRGSVRRMVCAIEGLNTGSGEASELLRLSC